jgi:hypothetical protein
VETDREHSDAGSSAEGEETLPRDEQVGSFAEGEETLPRDEHVGSFAEGEETLPRDEHVGSFRRGRGDAAARRAGRLLRRRRRAPRRLIQASTRSSPSALATRWARERAPRFVMAFRTYVRTGSWRWQLVGDLRSGAQRHEPDHLALAPRQRSRLALRGREAAERTSPNAKCSSATQRTSRDRSPSPCWGPHWTTPCCRWPTRGRPGRDRPAGSASVHSSGEARARPPRVIDRSADERITSVAQQVGVRRSRRLGDVGRRPGPSRTRLYERAGAQPRPSLLVPGAEARRHDSGRAAPRRRAPEQRSGVTVAVMSVPPKTTLAHGSFALRCSAPCRRPKTSPSPLVAGRDVGQVRDSRDDLAGRERVVVERRQRTPAEPTAGGVGARHARRAGGADAHAADLPGKGVDGNRRRRPPQRMSSTHGTAWQAATTPDDSR